MTLLALVTALYFAVGKHTPHAERILSTLAVFVLSYFATFVLNAVGQQNLMSNRVIENFIRLIHLSKHDRRTLRSLMPIKMHVGNFFFIDEMQVLLFWHTVVHLTVTIMISYPSASMFRQ